MMKILAKAVWIITAIASLNLGLGALGFDLFNMIGLSGLIRPLHLLFGLAGAASLAMLFMPCGSNCCE
jgi:uncharacterized membrane protein YuzA (DUF378 family)